MKSIITGGCSFTYNEGSWAYHIPNVINVARGGSGPVTSVREVLIKLRETTGDKICIFQVSNPCRKEIIINDENANMFQIDYNKVKQYDQNEAQYNVNQFHKQARENIALAISEEQRAVESYEMLTLLQLYCNINNIPLLMFYGWLDKRDLTGELIQKVLQGIDWTTWWQQGNNTMSLWLKEQGFTDKKKIAMDDQAKLRPTIQAHEYFYNQVIKPWIHDAT